MRCPACSGMGFSPGDAGNCPTCAGQGTIPETYTEFKYPVLKALAITPDVNGIDGLQYQVRAILRETEDLHRLMEINESDSCMTVDDLLSKLTAWLDIVGSDDTLSICLSLREVGLLIGRLVEP